MDQANRHHGDVFSQVVTPKQAIRGTNATTQASGLEDRQVQAHGGHKARQSRDLEKQLWIQSIEVNKHTHV